MWSAPLVTAVPPAIKASISSSACHVQPGYRDISRMRCGRPSQALISTGDILLMRSMGVLVAHDDRDGMDDARRSVGGMGTPSSCSDDDDEHRAAARATPAATMEQVGRALCVRGRLDLIGLVVLLWCVLLVRWIWSSARTTTMTKAGTTMTTTQPRR